MILHHYWRSTASYRVRVALGLKGIEAELRAVDLATGEHLAPPFAAIAPRGFLPVLEDASEDGPVRLGQSLAIIDYLDARYPQAPTLPARQPERARAMMLAHMVALDIHPVCNLTVLKEVGRMAGPGDAADARLAWNRHFIAAGLDALEPLLPESGFCAGEAPMLPEICLVPQLYNARRWGMDAVRWPRAARIEDLCLALPAFAAAAPERHEPRSAEIAG